MIAEKMLVVKCQELAKAVKIQYDLGDEFNIFSACFDSAEQGSYQELCIDENSIESAEQAVHNFEEWNFSPREIELARHRFLVLTYLHDVFPNEEIILVYMEW